MMKSSLIFCQVHYVWHMKDKCLKMNSLSQSLLGIEVGLFSEGSEGPCTKTKETLIWPVVKIPPMFVHIFIVI